MYNRFFEQIRFVRILYLLYALSALILFGLLFSFMSEGIKSMQTINIIAIGFYILGLLLILKRKYGDALFLAFFIASIYGFASTWALGWNSGFYLYIIFGYIQIYFLLQYNILTKILISLPITAALIFLFFQSGHSFYSANIYSSKILKYLPIFNFIVTITLSSIFAFFYTFFLVEVEGSLKDSIENMKISQLNLQYKINENKVMHEELVRNNALLDALMNHLPDYIYFKDTNSRFTRISKSMVKVFSVKNVDEMIGKSDLDIHNLNVAMKFKADEEQVMNTKLGIVDQLQHEFLLNGLEQWVSTTKLPLIDIHGNCIGTFGISKDVTYLKTLEIEAQSQALELRLREAELKQKEAEQRLLNQQKIKFFSVFSHDLKNPLNTLAGFTSLLWDKFDHYDEATKRKMLSNLVKLSDNMQGLIMNLLDWSRSQLNNVAVKPLPINLRIITDEIIHLYSYQQLQKEITTINTVNEKMIIIADIDIIKTVFRNLYFNAIKFTNIKGKIEVSAKRINNEVHIIFKDDGIGMKAEEVNTLFTLGESVSGIGTMNERGTGLGLIVCQEYLSKCNAHIKVESEIDKGSIFTVCIPVSYNL